MAFNKETGMYEGWIYKIFNDINTKLYIGQTTKTISSRFASHKNRAKGSSNQYIHNAMRSHGIEFFHVETIKKISCKDIKALNVQLDKLEQYYISVFNTLNPNGYNNTIGGKKYDGFQERDRLIYQYSLDGTLLSVFNSLKEASDLTGFDKTGISKCCLGKIHSSHGYIWQYYDINFDVKHYQNNFTNDKNEVNLCGSHVVKRVKQYDNNGKLVKIYNSALDAEIESDSYFKRQGIQSCCTGNSRIYKNYFWRYLGDELDKFDISLKRVKKQKENIVLKNKKKSNAKKIKTTHVSMRTRKIHKYDKSLNYIESYNNVYAIPNLSTSQIVNILNCCQGKQIFSNNFIWRFDGDDICKYKVQKDTWNDIAMIDNNNNIIKVFKNAQLAAEYVNGNRSSIIECCRGNTNRVTHKNYRWKYLKDLESA